MLIFMKVTKTQDIEGVPRRLRKIVSDAIAEYRYQLGMQNWKILITYADEDKEADNPIDTVAATIDVNRRYLEANIIVYPFLVTKWKKKIFDDEHIKETIAHEVCHIATQHFWDVATARYCDDGEMKDAWESCTSMLGKLVYRLAKKK